MARFAAAALLLPLLALGPGACARPRVPAQAEFDVHVIVRAAKRPAKGIAIRPVCTLGALVVNAEPRRIEPTGVQAHEVALFRAPRGSHRFSVWEPNTWSGARRTIDVERDLWVVFEIEPGRRHGALAVHEYPPHQETGGWEPLIPVPD